MENNVSIAYDRGRTAIIFLFFAVLIGATVWMVGLVFDEAFNFQVASSLANHFSYATTYIPTKIYNHSVTTNGPLQYFMAFWLKTAGLDLGRSIGLGIIGGVCAGCIYRFSLISFVMYCTLLLMWPIFAWTHCFFLGEVFEIAMIMLGLTWWLKGVDDSEAPVAGELAKSKWWGNQKLVLAGVSFGLAISTKLLAISIVPILLLCLYCEKTAEIEDKSLRNRISLFYLWVVVPFGVAIGLFFSQFVFSVVHSNGQLLSVIPIIKQFVVGHFNQAATSAGHEQGYLLALRNNLSVFLVLSVALLILVRRHISFIILVFVLAVFLFHFHLNMRRLSPLIVIPILLAGYFLGKSAAQQRSSSQDNTYWLNPETRIVLLCLLFILVVGSFIEGGGVFLFKHVRHFSINGGPRNCALVSGTQRKYEGKLLPIIKNLHRPIFVSGWWQFPEISLRSGVVFYDRFAPENLEIFQEDKPNYILFSSARYPKVKNTMCGDILYEDRSLVLCEHNVLTGE